MICVPVPDRAKEVRGGQTRVFMPPDGDMTNDTVRAAEVMLDRTPEDFPCIRMYWKLEEGELEKLVNNDGTIEITLMSTSLPPVDAIIY